MSCSQNIPGRWSHPRTILINWLAKEPWGSPVVVAPFVTPLTPARMDGHDHTRCACGALHCRRFTDSSNAQSWTIGAQNHLPIECTVYAWWPNAEIHWLPWLRSFIPDVFVSEMFLEMHRPALLSKKPVPGPCFIASCSTVSTLRWALRSRSACCASWVRKTSQPSTLGNASLFMVAPGHKANTIGNNASLGRLGSLLKLRLC